MPEGSGFSPKLLKHPEAANEAALARVALAKKRIQSVLDRDTVAHQKTLEQKIADQGPIGQRVDPHLIGLAIMDLLELNRLRVHHHPATTTTPWHANVTTKDDVVQKRLDELAPLYRDITAGGFGNLTGDALEIAVYQCLKKVHAADPRYVYQGHFELDQPKNNQGRFVKVQPPKALAGSKTNKEADFLQFGYSFGGFCIECKNYREWLYPHEEYIKQLIVKSYELGGSPLLVTRRIHYTTRTNLLAPAGIIAHESYHQYYPSDKAELSEKVRHRRLLGFTDILATENPHARTVKFFETDLPKISEMMNARWKANRDVLLEYAHGEINIAQLYTAIDSPAGGKWFAPEPELPDEYF